MNGISYSQGLFLTDIQRDSAYAKIQRGKIDNLKVKYLDSALVACDSVKNIKTTIIGIQEKQMDSLFLALSKSDTIIKTLEESVLLERKRGRRRAFWSFMKGSAVGVLLMAVLTVIF